MRKHKPGKREVWIDWVICFLLIVSCLVVYGQTGHYGFINYDDPDYVTGNPQVRAGLTVPGLVWALTSTSAANWFPVTRLSHMMDFQFFGLNGGMHHMTSVTLHILAALLLFAVFRRMTGSRVRSAVIALLFALHPLNVESVAWVAERKSVLSTVFFFLAIWGYLRYVDAPRTGRYLFMTGAFCLGLMSKAMVVTLPFLLLLLDVWPLGRLGTGKPGDTSNPVLPRVWEKAPLFLLSAAASVLTFVAQRQGGAVMPIDTVSPGLRLGNALVSYVTYIAKTFWPVDLAVFYPYPAQLPAWQVVSAVVILLGITAAAVCSIRTRPYIAVGWLWFLGSLIPVIGLIQIGWQARADRYMYIPGIGLFLMVVWGFADVCRRWRQAKTAVTVVALGIAPACLLLTFHQVRYWADSVSLFTHALAVTDDNYVAHKLLGSELMSHGKMPEAMTHFQKALSIRPQFLDALNDLGVALLKQGKNEEALSYLNQALQLSPRLPEVHINLGTIFTRLNRFDEAGDEFSTALRLQPDNSEAHCGMGLLLEAQGKMEEALVELNRAVRIRPDYADAQYNLGRVLAAMNRTDEAIARFRDVLRLDPDHASAHYNLGTALASLGKLDEAIAEFAAAVRLKPDYAAAHNNLGSALAGLGRYEEAIPHFREALRIDPTLGNARQNLEYALSLQTESAKPR